MTQTSTALTTRQEQFCQEYLIDLNGLQSAIRAGYSPKTAASQAARLLTNANVIARVQELKAARSTRTEITADRVLTELSRIAFADPRKVMTWGPDGVKLISSSDLSDDDAAVVSEVSESTTKDGGSLRVKLHDKISALEKIGKHLGMFGDRDRRGFPEDGIQTSQITWEEFIQIHRKGTITNGSTGE